MLSLIIKIKDIHHCKETDHVYPIVRTGHGQPTWSIRATWFSRHHVHVGDPWYRFSILLASVARMTLNGGPGGLEGRVPN